MPPDAGSPPSEPPGGHYFQASPDVASHRASVSLVLPDLTVELAVDRGVFSHRKVDPGTRVLLVDGPPIAARRGRLVDLGCGYGPIAVALAHRAPEAEIVAVDVNERALALAAENLAPYQNVRVLRADGVSPGLTVDEVWSNPPIRIGKPALHALLSDWHERLRPGGRMVLVVQRHLGADSLHRWLDQRGWATTRLMSRAGYRILEVAS